MSILLFTIATGQRYVDYAHNMIASAAVYFPEASTLVFTDAPQHLGAISRVSFTEAKGYPNETLYRYRTILSRRHLLDVFDHVFYIDADMLFVAPVGPQDIISDGITATLHPGYVGGRGTPEHRPESTAFCTTNTAYYCGGFQGGETYAYLQAAEEMSAAIDTDAKNGIIAVWHDESHWNRYLATHPPAKVLGPEYCYPEDAAPRYTNSWARVGMTVEPKIVALTKVGR